MIVSVNYKAKSIFKISLKYSLEITVPQNLLKILVLRVLSQINLKTQSFFRGSITRMLDFICLMFDLKENVDTCFILNIHSDTRKPPFVILAGQPAQVCFLLSQQVGVNRVCLSYVAGCLQCVPGFQDCVRPGAVFEGVFPNNIVLKFNIVLHGEWYLRMKKMESLSVSLKL